MPAKPIDLIVACAENRVFGRAGRLPWHIPEDLAWFHEKTAGAVCVLGRVCFEAWPRAQLDGRQPVVVTRGGTPAGDRVRAAADVPAALRIAQELPGDILVCGGLRLYEETLPLARRLYLTLVHAEVPGDVRFPEWRHLPWRELSRRESRDANYRYTFFALEK